MYYYKLNDSNLVASPRQLTFKNSIAITEEEYNRIIEEEQVEQEQETRAQKEALFRKLRAELYPPEEE